MPRHKSAMKDVASCEKPRGAASERRSGGIRMGQPGGVHTLSLPLGGERTQGTETSKYLEEKTSNEIPLVAASGRGRAQTGGTCVLPGLWGLTLDYGTDSGTRLEWRT